jgi:LCP family protein required for cell wall assembly
VSGQPPEEPAREYDDPSTYDWSHPDYRRHRHHRPHSRSGSRHHPHKWYRPRNTVLAPLVALLVVVLGFALYVNAQISGIQRAQFLPTSGSPAGAGTNIVLVGSESPVHSLALDESTMVVQVVHLSADGLQAAMVYLPRDLFITAPHGSASKAPRGAPVGRTTLAAVYHAGGNPLLVQAIQDNLGLRIDHVIQVGFTGYSLVTDRLGGVDMPVGNDLRHFTGPQALAYADATTGLVNGDVDTGQRHQAWLKAMLQGALTPSIVLNPFQLIGLLHDLTPSLVLDESLSTGTVRHLAWSSRHLRPDTIRYLTAPHTRFVRRPPLGKVLLPDASALRQLGAAMRTDNQSAIASFDN